MTAPHKSAKFAIKFEDLTSINHVFVNLFIETQTVDNAYKLVIRTATLRCFFSSIMIRVKKKIVFLVI